jgi:transposase
MPRRSIAVGLTDSEKEDLRELLKSGVIPARTVVRANALLRLNEGLAVSEVASLLELTGQGVRKIAMRYNAGGLEASVYEGPRPGKKPALDAAQKQKIVALACSQPPEGHARWTVGLFAAEVNRRKIVPGVGREVIRIALQDHGLKPWREKMWCVPALDATYVEQMQDVLAVYEKLYDPDQALRQANPPSATTNTNAAAARPMSSVPWNPWQDDTSLGRRRIVRHSSLPASCSDWRMPIRLPAPFTSFWTTSIFTTPSRSSSISVNKWATPCGIDSPCIIPLSMPVG